MKVLLIDDEANKGWKEILETIITNGENIKVATEYETAKSILLANEFDLIFLDIRFGEVDHHATDITKYGGYKILTELIRNNFSDRNFSTPVILFTATNKAWNICSMLDEGADSFYIKEHPEYAGDIDFSRNNYIRLKNNIPSLLIKGKQRREILEKSHEILKLSSGNIVNDNIRFRIEEKLKIGYGILFQNAKPFEKNTLLFNNEIVAFIVFWSILEEIVKDCFKDNWCKTGNNQGEMVNNTWILKNGVIFIEDLRIENLGQTLGVVRVNIKWNPQLALYEPVVHDLSWSDKDIKFYSGKVNLSVQVYSVLLLLKNWTPQSSKNRFENLNDYRNKIDFIHSTINSIYTERLSSNQSSNAGYNKCIEMLDFLIDVLK